VVKPPPPRIIKKIIEVEKKQEECFCHSNHNLETYYKMQRSQMETLSQSRYDMMSTMLSMTHQNRYSSSHSRSNGFFLPPRQAYGHVQQTYMQPIQVVGGYQAPPRMAAATMSSFYPASMQQ